MKKFILIMPPVRLAMVCLWLGLLAGGESMSGAAPVSMAVQVLVSKNPEGYGIHYLSGGAAYDEQFSRGMLNGQFEPPKTPDDSGDFHGSPAFQIQIKEKPSPPATPGRTLDSGWQWLGSTNVEDKPKGTDRFAITLSNSIVPLTVVVHTLLDGTTVFSRWLEIRNVSDQAIALTALAPWSGRLWGTGGRVFIGHSLRNDGGYEGWFGWTNLVHGTNTFLEPHGLAYDNPYFVLRNEDNGEFCMGELAWGMSYFMQFTVDHGVKFSIGPYAFHALRVIAPGETITTPAVHAGGFFHDFDSTVQAMQSHIRRSVLPPRDMARAYRIQCLMPGDRQTIYNGEKYNETNIEQSMKVAAAAGCELFIVDGPTWAAGYGDWVPRKDLFPHGFGPLRRYAHEHGLSFGIYAEPEGGRGDWSQTKAFKEHPDWFSQPGYVLNLSKPDAAAYMEQEWTNMIDEFKLDLYRHDFNTVFRGDGTITVRDGFAASDNWRSDNAFYAMTRRIAQTYPKLILQQASGGGTRLDLQTMGAWNESYTSDNVPYPHVQRAAAGLSVYLPPEILVTPSRMWPPYQDPDLRTMLRSAYCLGQTPMLFNEAMPPRLEDFKPGELKIFQHYARLYKDFIRPLLPTVQVYHYAPVNATGGVESGDWFAMGFASPDRRKGWATVVRLSDHAGESYHLSPRNVDPRLEYKVTFDGAGLSGQLSGAEIQRQGFEIHPPNGEHSALLIFQAVGKKSAKQR